jgi:hypothetical protein
MGSHGVGIVAFVRIATFEQEAADDDVVCTQKYSGADDSGRVQSATEVARSRTRCPDARADRFVENLPAALNRLSPRHVDFGQDAPPVMRPRRR